MVECLQNDTVGEILIPPQNHGLYNFVKDLSWILMI